MEAKEREVLYQGSVSSPMGECVVFATQRGVRWIGTPGTLHDAGLQCLGSQNQLVDGICESLQVALDELERYFSGERIQFSCPLDLRGTPFQVTVWQTLTQIPYGETRSYGQIAQLIGRPAASRAVGAANGANPIAIVVPCHRVIGSNGKLTGYGGGLPTKAWLLTLEGALFQSPLPREYESDQAPDTSRVM